MGNLFRFKSTETQVEQLKLLVIVEHQCNDIGTFESTDYSTTIERIAQALDPSYTLMFICDYGSSALIHANVIAKLSTLYPANPPELFQCSIVVIECGLTDLERQDEAWLKENWHTIYSSFTVQKPPEQHVLPPSNARLQTEAQALNTRVLSWIGDLIPPTPDEFTTDARLPSLSRL